MTELKIEFQSVEELGRELTSELATLGDSFSKYINDELETVKDKLADQYNLNCSDE